MAVTARIPLQVEPAEKQAIAAKAKALGISVNEYVRMAVDAFDLEHLNSPLLDAMLKEVAASTDRACAQIDETLQFIEESNRRIADMERRALSERVAAMSA